MLPHEIAETVDRRGSQIDVVETLRRHALPENRLGYIYARLALDPENKNCGVTLENAVRELVGAHDEGYLEPPLSDELYAGLLALTGDVEPNLSTSRAEQSFPTTIARFLLTWAIDHGSAKVTDGAVL